MKKVSEFESLKIIKTKEGKEEDKESENNNEIVYIKIGLTSMAQN